MVRPAASRLVAVAVGVLLLLAVAGCAGHSLDTRDAAQQRVGASPPPPGRVHRYVALGDSYTSAPLVPVTDVANGCFRSTGNYPTRVAKALRAHLVDRSCSGATTADLWRAQGPGIPSQLSAVTSRTDLVTLGIGGNDAGVFRRMLTSCAGTRAQTGVTAPCQDRMTAPDGRDQVLAAIHAARTRLLRAVREIHRRAHRARVLLVGYPQLLAAGRTCAQLPLAQGDYGYLERVNRALDANLRYAARAARATYVDVWAASQGHDICADQPWINGSQSDQQRAAAFHPFAVEQSAVARLVQEALKQ